MSNYEAAAKPNLAFPMMGYKEPNWVSPWEYCRLLRSYGIPCSGPGLAATPQEALVEDAQADPFAHADPVEVAALYAATEYLLVGGTITVSQGTTELGVVTRLTNPMAKNLTQQVRRMAYREAVAPSQALTYTVAQINGAGEVVGSNEITLNGYDGDVDIQPFFELVPLAGETITVEIRQGITVTAQRASSAHPPSVTLITPNGGEKLDAGSVVEWSMEDVDGDPLTANISYSRDGGVSWQLVQVVTGTSHTIQAALPGTTEGIMRVMVMDGFHSAQDDSDGTFTVPSNAPQAAILMPGDGEVFPPGSIVELRGTTSDLEDGPLEGASLSWTSSLSGTLGSGEVIALNDLPAGAHTITLTVTDSDAMYGIASVEIYIGSRAYLPLVVRGM